MNSAIILFFFSSRRRHTRLTCDWSSDVCSSDLGGDAGGVLRTDGGFDPGPPGRDGGRRRGGRDAGGDEPEPDRHGLRRSEERRVGKSVGLGGSRIIEQI